MSVFWSRFTLYSRPMLPAIDIFQERFGPIRYCMAPMAGITDVVYRTLIRELGAEIVVSELPLRGRSCARR